MQLKTSQRAICYVLEQMRWKGVWNPGASMNVCDGRGDSRKALRGEQVLRVTKCLGLPDRLGFSQ